MSIMNHSLCTPLFQNGSYILSDMTVSQHVAVPAVKVHNGDRAEVAVVFIFISKSAINKCYGVVLSLEYPSTYTCLDGTGNKENQGWCLMVTSA